MIEHIKRELFCSITFRYASQEENKNVLQEMGVAPENVEEMLAFLRDRNKVDSLESLLDKPFEPKSQLAPKPKTRFSDSTIRVFYSALEPETAEAEVFAYVRYALNNAGDERTAYYRRFACNFQGNVKDLRPHLKAMPYLIQDEASGGYPYCNRIGVEAVSERLEGLLTPSARKPEGTCLPVFSRAALSNPQSQDFVAFKFDPASGKISTVT